MRSLVLSVLLAQALAQGSTSDSNAGPGGPPPNSRLPIILPAFSSQPGDALALPSTTANVKATPSHTSSFVQRSTLPSRPASSSLMRESLPTLASKQPMETSPEDDDDEAEACEDPCQHCWDPDMDDNVPEREVRQVHQRPTGALAAPPSGGSSGPAKILDDPDSAPDEAATTAGPGLRMASKTPDSGDFDPDYTSPPTPDYTPPPTPDYSDAPVACPLPCEPMMPWDLEDGDGDSPPSSLPPLPPMRIRRADPAAVAPISAMDPLSPYCPTGCKPRPRCPSFCKKPISTPVGYSTIRYTSTRTAYVRPTSTQVNYENQTPTPNPYDTDGIIHPSIPPSVNPYDAGGPAPAPTTLIPAISPAGMSPPAPPPPAAAPNAGVGAPPSQPPPPPNTGSATCPGSCTPFDPLQNKCDITTSCTTTGGAGFGCACRAGYKAAGGPQVKMPGLPYVYVGTGVVCDALCDDANCSEVPADGSCM